MTKNANPSQVGVLLVTHADFGRELLQAAELILGPLEHCLGLTVDISIPMEQMIETIRTSVKRLNQGAGVIILTDMFGGTPSNLSLSLLGSEKVEVVTGVNLPMLLKILGSRTTSLNQLAADAKAAGKSGIIVAGEILRRKVSEG